MSYRFTAQRRLISPRIIAQSHILRASRTLHQSRVLREGKNISPAVQQLAPVNPFLNPPASTRPPPLQPVEPQPSTVKYYFQLGKSYVKFFTQGVKAVVTNAKLVKAKVKSLPRAERPTILKPRYIPDSFTRADWVLLWRTRHDVVRLPVFALFFLVCGEFTPLVVVFMSGILPFTCRFPSLMKDILGKAEQRRAAAFNDLESKYSHGAFSPGITKAVARQHILRTLDLSGAMWDRLGFTPPGMWNIKGKLRMSYLEIDDKRLLDGGGPLGLEVEELRIACSERGLDVLGKSEGELRTRLGDWLRLTAVEEPGERRRRMATLMMTRPENWPQQRNFAVPEWQL
ncbi:hypothetical protein BBK36DRAFT_1109781 [Trichoderma citrinoviride]|uniref:Letm1 RBD domain-containing protein n=1 Tax=Trichoderma citrinoviride TaxID=58853 RepID=A0A2T4BK39_9HYPO|nr:hypothetical protein BBK36DRAFT_1109781 [Trichoderma citrinoviride]PTB69672.1 hypothetical protein BBK36DRAFT_1109781 [Trichoderma citrinoviride]